MHEQLLPAAAILLQHRARKVSRHVLESLPAPNGKVPVVVPPAGTHGGIVAVAVAVFVGVLDGVAVFVAVLVMVGSGAVVAVATGMLVAVAKGFTCGVGVGRS